MVGQEHSAQEWALASLGCAVHYLVFRIDRIFKYF